MKWWILLLTLVATTYADGAWTDVVRNEPIMGDFEDTYFQVKTETAITSNNFVSLNLLDESGDTIGFIATATNQLQAGNQCYGEDSISHAGTSGGGIWTVLKSTYNVTVWFNDDIVTQYVYSKDCSLKETTVFGISFRDTDTWTDSASVTYRLDISDPPSLPRTTYNCQDPDDYRGQNYRGTHNTTQTGLTCQAWDVHSPNSHTGATAATHPGAGLDGNYCRNPDGEEDGPWCYNAESTSPRWQYCYVPRCESSLGECILESSRLWTGGFKNYYVSDKNATQCEENCIRWATCEAFTMQQSNGRCWLFQKGHGNETSDAGWVSGRVSCHTEATRYQDSDYVNVALLPNVTTSQTGNYWGGAASRAIDENRNTIWGLAGCSFSSSSKLNYWQVDLQKSYQIDHIIIYGRSEGEWVGALNGSKLLIGDQICQELSGMDLSPTQAHRFDCNGEEERRVGRIVRVENWGVKVSLCEIEIMVHKDLVDVDSQPTPDPSQTNGQEIDDYINVAYQKSVYESTETWGATSERAVDGWALQDWDWGTCSATNDNALPDWWSVDLGRVYQIDHIRVWGRTDGGTYRFAGAKVWIDDNICGYLTDNGGEAGADIISCEEAMMAGSVVKITKNKAHICLCEVQVMVRKENIDVVPATMTWPGEKYEDYTNVAIAPFATATQSSTGWGGNARRGNDGDSNGEWNGGSVTHTLKEGNSWWEVDLGRAYKIDHITIYGRTDGNYKSRIDGARVVVGGVKVVWLETPENAADALNVSLDSDTYGRRVRVELLNEYLSLAEVEVYVANDDVMSDEEPTDQPRWENVAWNRPTNASSTKHASYTPSRVVDNYPNATVWSWGSCTHSEYESLNWWEVDLEQEYYIDHIIVAGRSDCCEERLSYGTVTVDGRTVGSFGEVDEEVYFTFPLNGYRGQVVRVWNKDNHLTLCEVQVMVDNDYVPDASSVEPFDSSEPNLAYEDAQVSASSSLYGGDASLAVDGNIDSDFYAGSCSFSGPSQGDNWVKVQLASEKSISSVTIYPRLDAFNQETIDDAVVRVGDHGCGSIVYDAASLYYELDCEGASGSNVSVSKLGWLSVCEIVIHEA